jgi:RNA polymerase sigma-70 factor (ECF subfamily)
MTRRVRRDDWEVEDPCRRAPMARLTETAPDDEAEAQRVRSLVEVHYDFVWRSLRRLGVAEADVDDGVQQVFLIAARKIAALRSGSEVSFLFQTALRVAADRRRMIRRRREVVTDIPGEAMDSAPNPEDLLDLRRAREKLDEILDRMSLELRAVFTLFEVDQMTLTDIAQLLGVPRGTVASRLRRARAEFRSQAIRLTGKGSAR